MVEVGPFCEVSWSSDQLTTSSFITDSPLRDHNNKAADRILTFSPRQPRRPELTCDWSESFTDGVINFSLTTCERWRCVLTQHTHTQQRDLWSPHLCLNSDPWTLTPYLWTLTSDTDFVGCFTETFSQKLKPGLETRTELDLPSKMVPPTVTAEELQNRLTVAHLYETAVMMSQRARWCLSFFCPVKGQRLNLFSLTDLSLKLIRTWSTQSGHRVLLRPGGY